MPDSVKFGAGGRIVTTQIASGDVLRIDGQTGMQETLANLGPGLDNVAFVGDRIFVSSINGVITEILAPGKVRPLVQRGLHWPLALAIDADGTIFACDGVYGYNLRLEGDEPVKARQLGNDLLPRLPRIYARAVHREHPRTWVIATGLGSLARYRPAMGKATVSAMAMTG